MKNTKDSQTMLLDLLSQADKQNEVLVIQRAVSRSGMTRHLDLFIIINSEMVRITKLVSEVLEWNYSMKHHAIKVRGCGMDMHFHTVYNLSMALFCDGKYSREAAYRLKHKTI